jgi:hypothetical protein
MKNSCSFLSRLALPLILFSPILALADTITTFDVLGTVQNFSGGALDSCANNATCAFSGMLRVDVTTGTVENTGLDITFPGLPMFDTLNYSMSVTPDWLIAVLNSEIDQVLLSFTPAPTKGSLVGFTGGTIDGEIVEASSGLPYYLNLSGTITPVPEPSALVLLAGGLALLVFGLARRFRGEVSPSGRLGNQIKRPGTPGKLPAPARSAARK